MPVSPGKGGTTMEPEHDTYLRRQLLELLKGGSAHARFEDAIAGIPAQLKGTKRAGFPHSPWMLLEHLRIAQWDVLGIQTATGTHVSPDWPTGLLAARRGPAHLRLRGVPASRNSARTSRPCRPWSPMRKLTSMRGNCTWGDGQTILREALLLADHNAYHVAQLVDVRRLLGAWPEK